MTPLLDAHQIGIAGRLAPTNLRVNEPSFIALIGPNGSGKTSLLRALAGVEGVHGQVRVCGEALAVSPPPRRARLVGFLPATREFVWPIAVRDVLAMAPVAPEPARIDKLLAALELLPLASRPISALSTGERTRVLLARTLACRPRLLLLDEPLANLDPYWVIRTLDLVRSAVRETGAAAILSLHDLSLTDEFDRMLLVDGGQMLADGTPAEIQRSGAVERSFRVTRAASGWEISSPADRRSSP